MEKITHAAARIDGKTVYLALDHYTAFMQAMEQDRTLTEDDFVSARHEQGFVTSANRFVDRDEAFAIALANHQIDRMQDQEAFEAKWLEAGSLINCLWPRS